MGPLFLLSYSLTNLRTTYYLIVKICSIFSCFVGRIGGLNQTLLRKIIAYSSINHLAWILAAVSFSPSLLTNYFLIYTLVVSSITFILNSYQIFHISRIFKIEHPKTFLKTILFRNLFSLGGLPPFLGFIPKLIVIQSLTQINQIIWLALLLFTA